MSLLYFLTTGPAENYETVPWQSWKLTSIKPTCPGISNEKKRGKSKSKWSLVRNEFWNPSKHSRLGSGVGRGKSLWGFCLFFKYILVIWNVENQVFSKLQYSLKPLGHKSCLGSLGSAAVICVKEICGVWANPSPRFPRSRSGQEHPWTLGNQNISSSCRPEPCLSLHWAQDTTGH